MRLSDRIIAGTPTVKHGPKSWVEKLPEQTKAEFIRIKELLRAGQVSQSARQIAIAIVSECKAQGISVASVDRVRVWLTQD